MIMCPQCHIVIDGWVVETEETGWRVWQWRNGEKTGRVSARLQTVIEAIAVAGALNLFARDVI